jgi:nucleoside-diphosphate-sugar epimerase
MKILVTGATGFLGRRTVERLAPRHELTLLIRPSADRTGFPENVALVEGDVTDRASVERGAAGQDAILHAAALVKIDAPAAEFDRVNLGGLEHVLSAAKSTRVGRVVYVSSFIALGPTEGGDAGAGDGRQTTGVLDETAETRGGAERAWINDYERTKALADRRARQAIEEGAPLLVAYPGVIYGPGALTEGNIVVRHLLDLAHGRLPALLGRPERRWNYVFVEDVAAGLEATLERAPIGARYVLGGENITQARFYELAASEGRIRVPRLRMPDPVAKAAGAAMKGWARLRGEVPKLTPDLVEIYRHDWAYDSSRAARELDYRPRPFAEGLRTTLDWLRGTGAWPA